MTPSHCIPTILLAITSSVFACSRSYVATSYPRWHFNPNQWSYSGSHSTTGISNAAAGWNAAQGTLTIQPTDTYVDYVISDDDSVDPAQAVSSYTTHATYGCPNQQDWCGNCLDGTMIYQWKIQLNFGGSNGMTHISSLLGFSLDHELEFVMSHEFGHSMRLLDVTTTDCAHPTVMSSNEYLNCTPNFWDDQSCDVDNFNSAYSGWTVVDNSCVACDGSCD